MLSTPTSRPPQVFKNRSAAYDWLKSKQLAVGQTKFYEDCKPHHYNLVQPDKTIQLADLLAYIEAEFNAGPAGAGRSLGAEDRQSKLDALDLREKELKVDKLEREKRAEDDRWLLKEEAWAQMAGIVGLLRDGLRHHFHLGGQRLVHLAGGDPSRAPELYEGIEDILAKAFNEVAKADRMEVLFEEEEE